MRGLMTLGLACALGVSFQCDHVVADFAIFSEWGITRISYMLTVQVVMVMVMHVIIGMRLMMKCIRSALGGGLLTFTFIGRHASEVYYR